MGEQLHNRGCCSALTIIYPLVLVLWSTDGELAMRGAKSGAANIYWG